MQVTLSEQDVVLSAELHLRTILRIEEHAVPHLHRTHVGAGRHDQSPGQPTADGDGGGDDDAATAAPLARLAFGGDQDPIVQHPNREHVPIDLVTHGIAQARFPRWTRARSTRMNEMAPATAPAIPTSLFVRRSPRAVKTSPRAS